jgi:hypothetical protein
MRLEKSLEIADTTPVQLHRREAAISLIGKYSLRALRIAPFHNGSCGKQQTQSHRFWRSLDQKTAKTSWMMLCQENPRHPRPKAGRSCMFMPPWKTIMVPSCSSLQYMPMMLAKMQMIT